MTNLNRRRKTMKKTLWTIFKVVTFGFGMLFYVGEIATVYEHIRKPEPIVQPIMFMNRK